MLWPRILVNESTSGNQNDNYGALKFFYNASWRTGLFIIIHMLLLFLLNFIPILALYAIAENEYETEKSFIDIFASVFLVSVTR